MQSPTLSPTVWSDSSSTLAPEALLLGGWPTHWRPTTPLQLPLAMFHLHACPHLHLWPDHAAFGPAHLSLPFQHPGQFGPPPAPKAILLVGWCTHEVPTTTSHLPLALHACVCAHIPNLAALPHLDMSVCSCQPSFGGLFTTNQPQWPHYSYGWGTFYMPTTPPFHFFNFHAHAHTWLANPAPHCKK